MKHAYFSVLLVGVWMMGSFTLRAAPKGIAVLDADNQSDLNLPDLQTLSNLVTTAFKSLPKERYIVGTFTSAQAAEPVTPCDKACAVQKAGQAGADFAVPESELGSELPS